MYDWEISGNFLLEQIFSHYSKVSRLGPVNTTQNLNQWIPGRISLEVNRPEHESHQSPPSEIKKENSHSVYCTSSVEDNVFRCFLSINLHATRWYEVQCTEFVTNSYAHHTHRFLAMPCEQPEGKPFLLSSDSCVSLFKCVLSINDIGTQTVSWITGARCRPSLHIMRRPLLFPAAKFIAHALYIRSFRWFGSFCYSLPGIESGIALFNCENIFFSIYTEQKARIWQ